MKGIIQKQHAQINKEEIFLLFLSITAITWQPSAFYQLLQLHGNLVLPYTIRINL